MVNAKLVGGASTKLEVLVVFNENDITISTTTATKPLKFNYSLFKALTKNGNSFAFCLKKTTNLIKDFEIIIEETDYLTREYLEYIQERIVELNTVNEHETSEFKIPIVKHILLLIFTFGIWQLIWVYKTTIALNHLYQEEERNPTTKLLLYIFIPFYSIYWTYKSAQIIDKINKNQGKTSDFTTISLILSIFVPIVAIILMQDQINQIVD
jgi:hypothetical protein